LKFIHLNQWLLEYDEPVPGGRWDYIGGVKSQEAARGAGGGPIRAQFPLINLKVTLGD
jgi:hypothetical protein